MHVSLSGRSRSEGASRVGDAPRAPNKWVRGPCPRAVGWFGGCGGGCCPTPESGTRADWFSVEAIVAAQRYSRICALRECHKALITSVRILRSRGILDVLESVWSELVQTFEWLCQSYKLNLGGHSMRLKEIWNIGSGKK